MLLRSVRSHVTNGGVSALLHTCYLCYFGVFVAMQLMVVYDTFQSASVPSLAVEQQQMAAHVPCGRGSHDVLLYGTVSSVPGTPPQLLTLGETRKTQVIKNILSS